MNKREQAEMDDLRKMLLEARALRFTDEIAPDIPMPSHDKGTVNGWSYHVYNGDFTVSKACSSSTSHSIGGWDKTTSQRPIPLYSSELLATRAARAKLAIQCSMMLAKADRRIAILQENP